MSAEGLDSRGRRRVAITGLGVKTPAGSTIDAFWSYLLSGKSAGAIIKCFDPSELSMRFACEVTDFDPADYLGPKEIRRVDRVVHLGLAAAVDAFADAGNPAVDPARGAVIAGNGIGGLQTLEEQHEVYLTKGPARVSPFLIPMMMPNATAGHVSMHLGWTGPNMCISTACASGTHAVGEATRLIREGTSDIVLAGGVECTITPLAISAFARMGALSSRNDEPELASRPFDVDRDGFVMGEGAGFLVLEEWDHAIARGARVYGEIVGYGRSADAHHITAPAPGSRRRPSNHWRDVNFGGRCPYGRRLTARLGTDGACTGKRFGRRAHSLGGHRTGRVGPRANARTCRLRGHDRRFVRVCERTRWRVGLHRNLAHERQAGRRCHPRTAHRTVVPGGER